jgi:hypothetical protein
MQCFQTPRLTQQSNHSASCQRNNHNDSKHHPALRWLARCRITDQCSKSIVVVLVHGYIVVSNTIRILLKSQAQSCMLAHFDCLAEHENKDVSFNAAHITTFWVRQQQSSLYNSWSPLNRGGPMHAIALMIKSYHL